MEFHIEVARVRHRLRAFFFDFTSAFRRGGVTRWSTTLSSSTFAKRPLRGSSGTTASSGYRDNFSSRRGVYRLSELRPKIKNKNLIAVYDNNPFELRPRLFQDLKEWLKARGYEVVGEGTFGGDTGDYTIGMIVEAPPPSPGFTHDIFDEEIDLREYEVMDALRNIAWTHWSEAKSVNE